MLQHPLHWISAALVALSLAPAAGAAPLDDRLAAELSTRPVLRARLAAAEPAALAEAVGAAYEWGNGLPRDYPAALAWYQRAADAGQARALVQVGVMVEDGMGTPRDPAAAAALFRRAAAAGEVEGTVRLGMLYEWGRGVDRDRCEAARLYRTAADHGRLEAGVYLTLMHDHTGREASCSGELMS